MVKMENHNEVHTILFDIEHQLQENTLYRYLYYCSF